MQSASHCSVRRSVMLVQAIFQLLFTLILAKSNEWGSRVIGKKSGSSGLMVFRMDGVADIEAYDHFGKFIGNVEVIDGRCILTGQTIGSPCTNRNGDVALTVNEVRDHWKLMVKSRTEPDQAYTVLFVPDFKFPTPKEDAMGFDWDTGAMVFRGRFPKMYADYSVINFTAADTLTVTVDWGETDA
ncbi:unnamed protein product [Hydatigera taeniaeformis]|uniref:DUF5727 domain-containing protein n=1 Tax=Hydatigena taeniaeformis TaxID=6205 RepID=A0A0R3XAB7_HYDTA|nr:unnamed protein product [Hydatigera taeniaeformis]